MDRFLLRYRGPKDSYKDDLGRIFSTKGTKVLDDSGSDMGLLLVEGDSDALLKLMESMPGWRVYPQHYYELPEQRPQVRQGPEGMAASSIEIITQEEQSPDTDPPPQKNSPRSKAEKPTSPKKRK